jgi:hypothetical protein
MDMFLKEVSLVILGLQLMKLVLFGLDEEFNKLLLVDF